MKRCVFVVMAVLLSAVVSAVEYEVVVVDKGEALVVASVKGSGLHMLPLPEDVVDVRVEGALYSIKDSTLTISIGSTKKALVAYKTDHLTAKEQGKWNFMMEIPGGSDVVVNLPQTTIVHETVPEALIESTEYKTIAWQNSDGKISIAYSFTEDGSLPITGNLVKQPPSTAPKAFMWLLLVAGGAILLFVGGRSVIKYRKQEQVEKTETVIPIRSEKETVLKTLSENETRVVSLLMDSSGQMKRNILEKESNLAKSSLASTLYNLERKNIVKVNKTYAVHFVQLTDWFLRL